MAVLHVVQYSQPQVLAGYTVRTQAIVQGQQRLGLDPLVLTSPRHPSTPLGVTLSLSKGHPSAEEEEVGGIRHYRCLPEDGGGSPWVRDARRVKRLTARICEVVAARPDVRILHAHSPVLCGLAALGAGARLGLPVVYEVRGLWEEAARGRGLAVAWWPRYRLARRLEAHVCRRAHAVVTISEGLRREFMARGVPAGKIRVVGNGVDTQTFHPRHLPADWRRQHQLGDGPLILYLGALRGYEGVHLLIEALPGIRQAHPSAQLLIVGAGEARSMIARLAREAQPHVHLREAVPHASAPEFYASADLVVYPRLSTRATELVTPLKPLEAIAMGRPVVASSVGGLRELLGDSGAAVWVTPGDRPALARACADLIADAYRRAEMARLARDYAVTKFDWALVMPRYVAVYESAEGTLRRSQS